MSVSLCVLRIEIDEDLPEMANNLAEVEHAQEQKKKDRGARESKTITVETYASVVSGRSSGTGILPTSSRRSPPEASNDRETISFFCGNPLVEVTKGVLHLYKENELKETEEAKTLCLLSVPGALGAADLLAFAAACQQDICHVRVLRDGSPDHYMALFTFRTYDAAREFHTAFSGVPYSSLEPQALCHVAWVSRVEYARSGTPPPAHTELPTCPVCLERMDESVAGVLSVQCSHSFHADCLVRWSDARCPVCRCAQTPEPRERAVCLQCEIEGGPIEEGGPMGEGEGAGEALESYGSLWICLICGHVGCGRYEKGHAAKHFLASNHTYALQLGSNRVWDYAGDNFVHRLVQNKADGKLVAAEGGVGSDAGCHEKLDSAQLEFTYILTHQLDSQRAYYEEKINRLEIEHRATTAAGVRRAETAESEVSELRLKLSILTREHVAVERRMQSLANKVTTLQTELQEERGLASALASSHKQWQEQARKTEEALTKEVSELKEELRDVMFFVEARTSLAAAAPAEELAEATVTVAPAKPRRKRR
ncbi:BRCA1-associated protein isoform X1 [Danaus plexippus]|uniref:BRCA1-associated protein isoform X1 n=1 Tax=Danaus plexippus TaxID=13037 RepID=UPI002AB1BDF8|nr:BRCA1-associated protein isoform X1 [Danaus plexippus]